MIGPWNIVQAEFFHVGGRNIAALEALETEIAERIADGASLKTTVRYYDEGGFVTNFVKQFATLEKREKVCFNSVVRHTGLLQTIIDARRLSLARRLGKLRDRKLEVAAKQLVAVAETSGEIAVELPDRSFRPIRTDEVHDVLVRAERACAVWLFLFSPNELTADENVSVGNAM